jgi:hypothetical protein
MIVTATDSTPEIRKFPIAGKRAGTRMSTTRSGQCGASSPGMGRTLLFNGIARGSRNLWPGPLDGQGKLRQITSIDNDAIGHSSLSLDGTPVAFVSLPAETQIYLGPERRWVRPASAHQRPGRRLVAGLGAGLRSSRVHLGYGFDAEHTSA